MEYTYSRPIFGYCCVSNSGNNSYKDLPVYSSS